MSAETIGYYLAWIGTACWGVCFWWMHRISARQDELLRQLHEQGQRIERLSREEHEMIRQVHPSVEEIKENVEAVATAVAEEGAGPKRP